jgi:hypothetical protein
MAFCMARFFDDRLGAENRGDGEDPPGKLGERVEFLNEVQKIERLWQSHRIFSFPSILLLQNHQYPNIVPLNTIMGQPAPTAAAAGVDTAGGDAGAAASAAAAAAAPNPAMGMNPMAMQMMAQWQMMQNQMMMYQQQNFGGGAPAPKDAKEPTVDEADDSNAV